MVKKDKASEYTTVDKKEYNIHSTSCSEELTIGNEGLIFVKIVATYENGSNKIAIARFNIDLTAPTVPTVKFYKWKDNNKTKS